MKQYAGFIALAALSLAALGSLFVTETFKAQPSSAGKGQTTTQPSANAAPTRQGSGFDFYVLSLSWSPAFCKSDAGKNARQQCDGNKDHGFVVHGLWPQNERGYPEFCGSDKNERVPEALGRGMFDIMPSMGLIGHQWRKHGSCSGLSQADYFDTTRAAFERITLPGQLSAPGQSLTLSADEIEAAFTSANPGMAKTGVAVDCGQQTLEEVRICLNRDLSFRDCPDVDRRGCRAKTVTITPIR